MSTNITMPALSPTMEEGNLAKWLVKEGDTVSAGDVIAEIETDKATMEVEAVDEGVVAKILVAEGTEGVKVNAVIAVLAEDGEEVGDVDVSGEAPAAAAPAAAAAEAEAPAAAPAASEAPAAATPAATPAPASEVSSGERVFATPLARRIAEQGGLDISAVSGSGPHGRIVKADVEAALASGMTSAPAAAATAAAAASAASGAVAMSTGMSDDMVLRMYAEDSYEKKPHDGMRKVIAERLTESTQSIPNYFITMDCELDALLALRSQMNAGAPTNDDGKPIYKISVNDFIVKAMALALKAVPMANVSWTSTDRLYHKHADVGVAVAVEDGLFTPIVRQAELKSLSEISAEVKDMAGRARNKKLKPEEYQGGCTAVSNLGMFGVKEFTSIINPPHASIVSIGAGEKRAVVKGDELAVATIMAATFAFDHRAIDGALGAELAAAFMGYVENPLSMLV
ncbi:MAG: pyruvate dehydrogenase complex dihydrolipoamide acetyltransferase [Rhizobiaceae bacterium]